MIVFNPLVIFSITLLMTSDAPWCFHRATDHAAGPSLFPAHADWRQHVAWPQSAQVSSFISYIYDVFRHSLEERGGHAKHCASLTSNSNSKKFQVQLLPYGDLWKIKGIQTADILVNWKNMMFKATCLLCCWSLLLLFAVCFLMHACTGWFVV